MLYFFVLRINDFLIYNKENMVFVNTIMETIVESALIEAVTPDSCSDETNSQKTRKLKKVFVDLF